MSGYMKPDLKKLKELLKTYELKLTLIRNPYEVPSIYFRIIDNIRLTKTQILFLEEA